MRATWIDIPKWVVDTNEYISFVKHYSAGKDKILWETKSLQLMIGDPEWLSAACESITRLSRYELCTLYTYTTQMYSVVTGYLRHKCSTPFDTQLVHNPEEEWLAGYDILLSPKRSKAALLDLTGKVDKELVAAWKQAKAIQITSEETAEAKWALEKTCYTALRPYFTTGFLKRCRDNLIDTNQGILLFPQAVRVFKMTPSAFPKTVRKLTSLRDFKRAIPVMDNTVWTTLLKQFVNDVDSIIQKMPTTTRVMSCFRGVPHRISMKDMLADPAYISTTLSNKIASSFVDRDDLKCCVYRFTLPIGSKMLPMMPVTRYSAEQEVLLPRHRGKYGVVRLKTERQKAH